MEADRQNSPILRVTSAVRLVNLITFWTSRLPSLTVITHNLYAPQLEALHLLNVPVFMTIFFLFYQVTGSSDFGIWVNSKGMYNTHSSGGYRTFTETVLLAKERPNNTENVSVKVQHM